MDADDLEPRKEQPKPKDLEAMSIEALRDYIAELEAKIGHAERTIAAKEKAREGAETFFKK